MTADPFGPGRSSATGLEPGEQAVADRLTREAATELAAEPTIVTTVLDRLDRGPAAWRRAAPGLAVAASFGVLAVIAWRAGIAVAPGGRPAIVRPPAAAAAAADRSTRAAAVVERAGAALTDSVQEPFRREAAAARDLGGAVARRFTDTLGSRVRLLSPDAEAPADADADANPAGDGVEADETTEIAPNDDAPDGRGGSIGAAGSVVPSA